MANFAKSLSTHQILTSFSQQWLMIKMFYKTKSALLFFNPYYANIANCLIPIHKNTIVLLVKKEKYHETLIDKEFMFTFLPVGHSIHKLLLSLDQFDRWFAKHENP